MLFEKGLNRFEVRMVLGRFGFDIRILGFKHEFREANG